MDPVTIAALVGAGTQVAGGIATGIGKARAGKKMMLTAAQEKELEELQRRQARGELGLTERERGAMTQQFLASQAGAQRELEAAALQQAAARGLSGATSGRDIFLQEMAQAESERKLRQEQNVAMEQANAAEAEKERARVNELVAEQKAAKAMRAEGITQALTLGLAAAGAGSAAALQASAQAKQQSAEAAAKAGSTSQLTLDLNAGKTYPRSYTFGGMQAAPAPTLAPTPLPGVQPFGAMPTAPSLLGGR